MSCRTHQQQCVGTAGQPHGKAHDKTEMLRFSFPQWYWSTDLEICRPHIVMCSLQLGKRRAHSCKPRDKDDKNHPWSTCVQNETEKVIKENKQKPKLLKTL